MPLGHCPLLPTPAKACFAKKRHLPLVPAFVGHLDGVEKPSVSVLLPSPLASEPALGSAGNLDMERQIIPHALACERLFLFFLFFVLHLPG